MGFVKYNLRNFKIYEDEGENFPNIIFEYDLKDEYGSIEEGKELFYYFLIKYGDKKIYLFRRDKSINYYYFDNKKKRLIRVFNMLDDDIFKMDKEKKAEYIFKILENKGVKFN